MANVLSLLLAWCHSMEIYTISIDCTTVPTSILDNYCIRPTPCDMHSVASGAYNMEVARPHSNCW